jgi:hypothetical protein
MPCAAPVTITLRPVMSIGLIMTFVQVLANGATDTPCALVRVAVQRNLGRPSITPLLKTA